ncbi:MAG: pyrimidine-nucleoside phosphorylase [Bacilli bacterium]|jgi:pyrimidine-nucleoside phosphorylase|nr:pyrimidine-nucleoside phosphorylase [Bacilli bacterium]
MNMIDILEKKKRKEELTDDEISYWIKGYCEGKIPDYQVSALLMAIRLNGMSKAETFSLTESMMHSGEMLNLSAIQGVKADKHSTGGVGDKTSMALCPMVASLGLKIAKMSGRGLGFTGGTLDKLESIPGMKVILTPEQFIKQVNDIGISIIGQSDKIDLADKYLYALRDVTGTVDSMPLIASSIMSKKLASGCDDILLDVKYGTGAFMQTQADAEELAKLMVEIGTHFGKNVEAEISSMNQPLGLAIGNSLEVKEAIATLHGKGPKDFTELCLSSGSTMLLQAGIFKSRDIARAALQKSIDSGMAFETFKKFIEAQGGDTSYIDDPSRFPTALYSYPVRSMTSGYVTGINTMEIGLDSCRLGAGRETKDDLIDPAAGILINKKLGDKVARGDILMTLYTEKANMSSMVGEILNTYEINEEAVPVPPVVEELISVDPKTKEFVITKE